MLAAAHRAVTQPARSGAKQGSTRDSKGTDDGLRGILGALGDLIDVPAELEKAMEAALGGRVQDIVVERWQDAEAAVAYLKQTQNGRATFLPLDSLRPGRDADVPKMPGVLGLASDLVRFDAAIRPAVDVAVEPRHHRARPADGAAGVGQRYASHAGDSGWRDRATERQCYGWQRGQPA